jgi:hypothetical protein
MHNGRGRRFALCCRGSWCAILAGKRDSGLPVKLRVWSTVAERGHASVEVLDIAGIASGGGNSLIQLVGRNRLALLDARKNPVELGLGLSGPQLVGTSHACFSDRLGRAVLPRHNALQPEQTADS